MEMQTRHRYRFPRLAEAQFDTAFIRLNGVDALDQPEDGDDRHDDDRHATVETAGNDVAQLILAAPDNVFQIGRSAFAAATRAVRPLAPWSLIITAAAPRAAAAILIAPGHQNLVVR